MQFGDVFASVYRRPTTSCDPSAGSRFSRRRCEHRRPLARVAARESAQAPRCGLRVRRRRLRTAMPDQALNLVGPSVDPSRSCRSVQIVRVAWTIWTHQTIWMLPRMLPRRGSRVRPVPKPRSLPPAGVRYQRGLRSQTCLLRKPPFSLSGVARGRPDDGFASSVVDKRQRRKQRGSELGAAVFRVRANDWDLWFGCRLRGPHRPSLPRPWLRG